MAALKARVRRLLQEQFHGAAVKMDPTAPDDKVHGELVWSGFEGKDQLDRQLQVLEALRSDLQTEEVGRVGLIVTVTPNEMAVMREG